MNLDRWLASSAQELAELSELADGSSQALGELLTRGLEWLSRVAPYDLAVVFELEDKETLVARAVRGALHDDGVEKHRIKLDDFPSIRMALEEQRCRVFTEEDHAHGDGDPFDGLMDFPHGHSCMVAPLTSGREVFGIITLDRRECSPYPRTVVDLVEVFVRLLALNIRVVRQSQSMARLRLEDQERLEVMDRKLRENTEGLVLQEDSRHSAVRELLRRAMLVAPTQSSVLLLGETGTGKERLARLIHEQSPRKARPFVPVNCAALPAGLLESELFGHVKGAFTGAARSRAGLFRAAHGGTLFLDEIGELPLELQAKLLRALQQGEVQALGSDQITKVDVRVIAATNVSIEDAVKKGRFREDLFYRLSVYPLQLIPLRERRDDLPALCEVLLDELKPRIGKRALRLSRGASEALSRYHFPGNIRELSNLLERAAILSDGIIEAPHLNLSPPAPSTPPPSTQESPALVSLAENERRYLTRVLEATQGRIYGEGGAAEIAQLPPTTLQSRMKKLGLR
jgi:formate hydrogenlyase transcriptional activator